MRKLTGGLASLTALCMRGGLDLDFLLRNGRVNSGKNDWTTDYGGLLSTVIFEHPAKHILLLDGAHTVAHAEAPVERLRDWIL